MDLEKYNHIEELKKEIEYLERKLGKGLPDYDTSEYYWSYLSQDTRFHIVTIVYNEVEQKLKKLKKEFESL